MYWMIKTFAQCVPLGVAVTGICLLVHVSVQQNYRQSLNDPQIQIAEDAARKLTKGDVPASVVPRVDLIDIAHSLAPWIAIYDHSMVPLEASGELAGAPPQPPKGVFDATDPSRYEAIGGGPAGENRVTWQPLESVRQAIVVVRTDRYFVVVGRNMREVEEREGTLGTMVFLAWLVILGATFSFKLVAAYATPRL